ERRQVRTVFVVRVLKRGPRRVHQECAQDHEDHERLQPPRVAPHGLTPAAARQLNHFRRHEVLSIEGLYFRTRYSAGSTVDRGLHASDPPPAGQSNRSSVSRRPPISPKTPP